MTSVGFILLTLTSLTTAMPIQQLIPNGCQIFYGLTVAHNTLLVTGGFVMALFRVACINSWTNLSMGTLVDTLLCIQYVWVGILLTGYYTSTQLYGSSSLLEFCHGYTTKMAHILMKYGDVEDESIQWGKYTLSILLSFGQVMILLEFIFYIIMLQSLREKDKSLVNTIQKDILEVHWYSKSIPTLLDCLSIVCLL